VMVKYVKNNRHDFHSSKLFCKLIELTSIRRAIIISFVFFILLYGIPSTVLSGIIVKVHATDAGDDENDDDKGDNSDNSRKGIPRLASQLPSGDLCVDCWSNKNIITGQGLIVGTDHVDYIIGSTFDDRVFAKDSPDIVFLDLGIDRLYGGPGGDSVEGGPGNDQLLGEGGDDSLFGGFDDDLLVGGPGDDHLFGDIGNDILIGGPGANYFDCGDGIDEIIDFNPAKGDILAGNCEIF
jgi:Ca2+-binding RTX toxin-like protein